MTRPLTDTRDIDQVMKDAIRPPALSVMLHPPRCPRCTVPMCRDLDKTQYPVFHCPHCVTNWTHAI